MDRQSKFRLQQDMQELKSIVDYFVLEDLASFIASLAENKKSEQLLVVIIAVTSRSVTFVLDQRTPPTTGVTMVGFK